MLKNCSNCKYHILCVEDWDAETLDEWCECRADLEKHPTHEKSCSELTDSPEPCPAWEGKE